MLQNAYFLAKIGGDTAENEQHFAEILKFCRNFANLVAPGQRAAGARALGRGARRRLRPPRARRPRCARGFRN